MNHDTVQSTQIQHFMGLSSSLSTHNTLLQRRVFPGNRLHWYWQTIMEKKSTQKHK